MRIDLASRPASVALLFCLTAFSISGCPGDSDSPPPRSVPGASTDDSDSGVSSGEDAGADDSDAGSDSAALCGSRGLPGCPTGTFCDYPESAQCGDADAPGECRPLPQACTFELAPVCGCDGLEYPNSCAARIEGVAVRNAGKCTADSGTPPDAGPEPADAGTPDAGSSDAGTPRACGGLRGLRCGDDQFCDYAADAMCGRADATGTCQPRRDGCTREYRPVCGCDGKTYSNRCVANSQGVSVETEGECKTATTPPTPKRCGARAGNTCSDDEYCNFPASAMCGRADAMGTCERRPEACTFEYAPVCGCDGVEYGNACAARAGGTSPDKVGGC